MNKKCPYVTKWIVFITDGTALLLVQNDLLQKKMMENYNNQRFSFRIG